MTATRRILFTTALAAIFAATAPGTLPTPKRVVGAADPVKEEPPITEEERSYWSFKTLLKPQPPTVRNTAAVVNGIDAFVLAKLEAAGRTLAPPAAPATLIRRLTFDLTGLPPTPEDVRAFVAACESRAPGAPDPYEALVDTLLASPRYGEKWAQHWLDLARYAETDGFELDKERKDAWKYRDWVIQALNDDMPFDDFVAFQIAGDEMSPANAVATGFLLAGPDMPDSNFPDERRHLFLNDLTGTIGTAFLGLTIGCAQCHDHPHDPISQADFYRFRAFFDNLPKFKKDQQLPAVMTEAGPKPAPSRVYVRGDHERPGAVVVASFPRIANASGLEVYPTPSKKSSGRRTALARWLTQPTNRLFVRAAANRLWQNHFGQPLVGTPGDLGHQGETPVHGELLDWLATEFPLRKWSLKAIHRLMVTSATYRQAAQAGEASAEETEADGELLSHFFRRRLSGEEIRDTMLAIAGQLNLKPGGPSVRLPLPAEVGVTLIKGQADTVSPAEEQTRRSIYVFARRNLRYPLFDLFDRPDALLSCSRRHETTTAPQALTLFNSEFSQQIARAVAAKVAQAASDPAAQVTEATWLCLSRPPTEAELALGVRFLADHTAHTGSADETLADYCLALINANAFCYVD